MSFLGYLLDHLGFILAYYLGVGVAILILLLEQVQSSLSSSIGAISYAFILATAILFVAGIWDYQRSKPFYDRLRALAGNDSPLETAASPLPATNRLESLVAKGVSGSFHKYQEDLNSYRSKHEERQVFGDRWAHHMKSPVSVISLLTQEGKGVRDLDKAKSIFQSIEDENQRLLHGINLFLNWARLDRFEVDVHIETLDLVTLAREAINLHKREFVLSSIFPKLESQESQVYVATDRKWMGFVLDQLITNAIKYTRPVNAEKNKSLWISIEKPTEVKTLPDTGKLVYLVVRDEGIGIPQEDLPRIFHAFFTGKNGRLLSGTTGMGLYLAHQVLKRLGHTISCQSEVGKGTMMRITFSSDSIVEGTLR